MDIILTTKRSKHLNVVMEKQGRKQQLFISWTLIVDEVLVKNGWTV